MSQYSRVKVPAEAIGGKQHEKIEYRSIGLSEGFGSFHISQETLGLMGTLIGRSKEARKVNSIFGEGVNPLMRKIREGMELLGLPSDVLMNHGNKRVVYGVALARNFRDVLLGFTDSAQYNVPRTRDRLRTEKIAISGAIAGSLIAWRSPVSLRKSQSTRLFTPSSTALR